MLKINSYLNTSNNEDPVESTVVVESDSSDVSVDTVVIKEDNDNLYVGTIVKNNCTSSEVHLNTVIINNNSVVNCSQVVAKNNSDTNVKWAFVSLTGETLYSTTDCSKGSICVINLDFIKMKPNTKFKLKALINDKEDTSCVVLEFTPQYSHSANFVLKGTCFKSSICYLGSITI